MNDMCNRKKLIQEADKLRNQIDELNYFAKWSTGKKSMECGKLIKKKKFKYNLIMTQIKTFENK